MNVIDEKKPKTPEIVVYFDVDLKRYKYINKVDEKVRVRYLDIHQDYDCFGPESLKEIIVHELDRIKTMLNGINVAVNIDKVFSYREEVVACILKWDIENNNISKLEDLLL